MVTPKLTFTAQLYNSLRRYLDVQPALLATAMGVYESGTGTASPYKHGYNVFNITDGGYWSGKGREVWEVEKADDEYDSAGNYVGKITQRWRVYKDLDESVDDYISFLSVQNGGRYKKAYAALQSADSYGFVYALYDARYFTLAPDKYLKNVQAVLNQVKTLTGGLA